MACCFSVNRLFNLQANRFGASGPARLFLPFAALSQQMGVGPVTLIFIAAYELSTCASRAFIVAPSPAWSRACRLVSSRPAAARRSLLSPPRRRRILFPRRHQQPAPQVRRVSLPGASAAAFALAAHAFFGAPLTLLPPPSGAFRLAAAAFCLQVRPSSLTERNCSRKCMAAAAQQPGGSRLLPERARPRHRPVIAVRAPRPPPLPAPPAPAAPAAPRRPRPRRRNRHRPLARRRRHLRLCLRSAALGRDADGVASAGRLGRQGMERYLVTCWQCAPRPFLTAPGRCRSCVPPPVASRSRCNARVLPSILTTAAMRSHLLSPSPVRPCPSAAAFLATDTVLFCLGLGALLCDEEPGGAAAKAGVALRLLGA